MAGLHRHYRDYTKMLNGRSFDGMHLYAHDELVHNGRLMSCGAYTASGQTLYGDYSVKRSLIFQSSAE